MVGVLDVRPEELRLAAFHGPSAPRELFLGDDVAVQESLGLSEERHRMELTEVLAHAKRWGLAVIGMLG